MSTTASRDHDTQTEILNAIGSLYIGAPSFAPIYFWPLPEKDVYTLYLSPVELTMNNTRLKVGEKYYNINIDVLFDD